METRRQNSGTTAKKKIDLWSFFDKNNNKHSYILSLCLQYGWRKPHPVKAMDVVDLWKLHRWLKSAKCPVRKPLMAMTATELSKVITALENMVQKEYKKP